MTKRDKLRIESFANGIKKRFSPEFLLIYHIEFIKKPRPKESMFAQPNKVIKKKPTPQAPLVALPTLVLRLEAGVPELEITDSALIFIYK